MVISIAMKMERERSQRSSCVALTRTQSKVFEWILLLNSWMKWKFSFTTAVVPSWCYIPWCHCRQRGPLVWELASHAGGGYSVGSNLGVRVAIFVFFAHFFFLFICSFFVNIFYSLRRKCFRLVSEQKKTEDRNDARNKILGFGRARNETSAKKWKSGRGRGRKKVSFLSSSPPPHSFACAVLTLVPRSLLLNRTETLATQAIYCPFGLFPSILTADPNQLREIFVITYF